MLTEKSLKYLFLFANLIVWYLTILELLNSRENVLMMHLLK